MCISLCVIKQVHGDGMPKVNLKLEDVGSTLPRRGGLEQLGGCQECEKSAAGFLDEDDLPVYRKIMMK